MPHTYNSQVTYTGNGSSTTFTVPFPYLDASDLVVTLNGTNAAFTVPYIGAIHLAAAPASGVVVQIKRVTPIFSPEVQFVDGSTITETNLNTNANQCVFAIGEINDGLYDVSALYNALATTVAYQGTLIAALMAGGGGGGSGSIDTKYLMPQTVLGETNMFAVGANGAAWVKKTTADVKTILGISAINSVVPSTGFTMLGSSGGVFVQYAASDVRTALGLGDLATSSLASLGLGTAASKNVGTAANNVLALDSSGNLPTPINDAVTQAKTPVYTFVVRRQTAYNVNGGANTSAMTWNPVTLTDLTEEFVPPGFDTGLRASLSSGQIVLPPGTYAVEGWGHGLWLNYVRYRLKSTSGSPLDLWSHIGYTGSTDITNDPVRSSNPNIRIDGLFGVPLSTTARLEVLSTSGQSDARALGRAHNVAGLGNNEFVMLRFRRLA